MRGVCAKQIVVAIIESPNGKLYTGSNYCLNAQCECPRDLKGYESGYGYELCTDVCKQVSHAEIAALKKAGFEAKNGTLYLHGHTYCCADCTAACVKAGIKEIVIVDNNKRIKL